MGKKIRSWTDEQLVTAVAGSTSYRGVLRALGLGSGSGGYIKRHVDKVGLDTSHFRPHARFNARDEQLKELVSKHETATEILGALGLPVSTYHFNKLKRRLKLIGADASKFKRGPLPSRRWTSWSDEQLRNAVSSSTNYSAAIRKLGLIPEGGNYRQVKRRVRELALDTSHFASAITFLVGGGRKAAPISELLVAGSEQSSHGLKKRLFAEGLKFPACEICGWAARRPSDGVIPVELDHINGDNLDNRIENLRILCPNCHSLQTTHRGLNKKRATRAGEPTPAWLRDWYPERDSNPHALAGNEA
jgi:hypothetical protein